jgi:oligosaccharyltransferase complex subunit gamma
MIFSVLLVLTQVLAFSLDFRYEKLKETSQVIDLDSKKFKLYTEEPRNYTVFMLMTTSSPEHRCVACKDFEPEYTLVAKNHGKDDIFFGILDYVVAPDIFSELKINNVPLVLRFPPTTNKFKISEQFDKYDLARNGFKAEPFASYISKTYETDFKVKRPIDYTPFLFFGLGGIAFAVVAMALKDLVFKVLGGKAPWLLLVLVIVSNNQRSFLQSKLADTCGILLEHHHS